MKKIKLYFTLEDDLPINTFALNIMLHGLIMELVPPNYADYLHKQAINPYSQYVVKDGREYVWILNLMDDNSISIIGEEILKDSFNEFVLKSLNKGKAKIRLKEVEEFGQTEIKEVFYQEQLINKITVRFVNPTAFKQNGEYIFYPDLRLIFQSLLMKYSYLVDFTEEWNESLLEEILQASRITSYQLQSYYYQIHRARIPGFMGRITIDVRAPQTLVNFIMVLLKFGEYSGVGVKTSMGMGSLELEHVR